MYKNYIFDCGNVLFSYSRNHLLDVYVGDDKSDRELVFDVVFTSWYLQDTTMPSKEYYNMCINKLPTRLHEATYNIIFNWHKELKEIKEVHDLIKLLKANNKKLYLLSNMPDNFTINYKEFDIFSYFDGIIFSFNEKIAKPDTKIYELLIDRYNIDPNESIFIDDNKYNCDASKVVGIKSYLFNKEYVTDFISYIKNIEGLN